MYNNQKRLKSLRNYWQRKSNSYTRNMYKKI